MVNRIASWSLEAFPRAFELLRRPSTFDPANRTRAASGTDTGIDREQLYTYVGLAFLTIMSALVLRDFGAILLERIRTSQAGPIVEGGIFLLAVGYLIFGSVLYHVCRIGYLKRLKGHRPASRSALETIYDGESAPPLVVLVPSYREEERVIRQTLMSAALMEYPDRRVVLLIDDPPEPADPDAAAALRTARRLPERIQALLDAQETRYAAELAGFEQRRSRGALNPGTEARRLSRMYRDAARWMRDLAAGFEVRDHTDRLFVERILREPAAAHRRRAREIAPRGRSAGRGLSPAEMLREYRRLAALFRVRVTSFERKRFVNLSHAPNKAMNLNSYIGLIGRSFREAIRSDGVYLEECESSSADLRAERAEYVITVDADSLLLHDYALRLTRVMGEPHGQRFGVVQTPYTAVPGTPISLERAAGAQTDIQWIMGQGMTHFGATFWIGASAVLRYKALEDICEIECERGHAIRKYVRDRTLTEDSDSTIDLVAAGWQLYNYPDRLSYSATPPDFGALVIQRRRWANGSLLILPKLFRYLLKNRCDIRKLPEAILRTQYLTSTAIGCLVAMVLLLLYHFEEALPSRWLPWAALPYYVLNGRDLVLAGYRWRDLFQVYVLTVLLIPVNLGGVVKSLHQWWTGRLPVFARTPKITGRTAAPALYILTSLALPLWTSAASILWMYAGKPGHALFSFVTTLIFLSGPVHLIGVRGLWEDLVANVVMRATKAGAAGHAAQPRQLPSIASTSGLAKSDPLLLAKTGPHLEQDSGIKPTVRVSPVAVWRAPNRFGVSQMRRHLAHSRSPAAPNGAVKGRRRRRAQRACP
jgi:cellulose synthase (UDP-forming)